MIDPTILAAIDSWPAASVILAVLLLPHVVTYVQGRRTKALVTKAATDAAATREQTENEHQDHPTPNMRQQLDAQDTAIGEIRTLLTDHIAHAGTVDERRDAWQALVEQDLARRRRPLLSWRY